MIRDGSYHGAEYALPIGRWRVSVALVPGHRTPYLRVIDRKRMRVWMWPKWKPHFNEPRCRECQGWPESVRGHYGWCPKSPFPPAHDDCSGPGCNRCWREMAGVR